MSPPPAPAPAAPPITSAPGWTSPPALTTPAPAPAIPAVPHYSATQAQPTVPLQGLIANLPPGLLDKHDEPPAAPTPTPAPVPAPAPAPDLEEDFDETVIAPRRGPAWTITGPDGAPHAIRTLTIIGRAPVAPADRPGADPLPLADPTKSLSKSHALIEPEKDALVITDLGSTNGVVIIEETGAETEVPPGVRVPLLAGTVLELGEFRLVISRD